jgi:hypothetical protein
MALRIVRACRWIGWFGLPGVQLLRCLPLAVESRIRRMVAHADRCEPQPQGDQLREESISLICDADARGYGVD